MEIAAAEPLTGDASLAKFPVRRDSVRGSESGGDPEHGKWLLRSSAESGAWRSSDSTAAQSTYAVEQGEGGGARVRGGAGGDGMQGGRVALLIGLRGT